MSESMSENESDDSAFGLFGRVWGTLSVLGSMYASRFWLAILPLGLVAFLLIGLPLVAAIVGQFWPGPKRLESYYSGQAEKEKRDFLDAEAERLRKERAAANQTADGNGAVKTTADGAADVVTSEKSEEAATESLDEIRTSTYGELLYQRLLQLKQDAPSVKMLLALKLAREGKLGQARELVAELAPIEGGGYAPAHNWLAVDLLARESPLNEEEQKTLVAHLEESDRWPGTTSNVRAAYAQLLVSRGEGAKAIEVLERAVKQDPDLHVMLTAVAADVGEKEKAEESGLIAEENLRERVEANSGTAEDYFNLAQLMLIREEPLKCLEYVEKGLALKPENPQLFRRLGSNALLAEFRKSLKDATDGTQWKLDLLDAALKADPTNPELSTELSRVISFGVELPEEIEQQLKGYLASGKATALLHFVISQRDILGGKLPDALKHLEIANQLAPGSPVIMNNLAVVQMMVDNTQMERSLGLIDECFRIGGPAVEFIDSRGQILLMGGKPMEAIAPLERAIEMAPDRIDTRTSLVDAYRKLGMEDMAKLQEEKLAALKKEQAEKEAAKKGN
jgi:tetratricopeptide (TPR) repeat protein